MKQKYKALTFSAIYLFFWLADSCLSPYLGIFYESRGLSPTRIGVINTVFSLAIISAALAIGVLGDKFGKPKKLLVVLFVNMIVGTFFLFNSKAYIMIFIAIIIYGVAYAPINGIVDKLLMDHIKEKPQLFGRYRSGGTIGAGIGVIISGIIIARYDYLYLFIAFWIATVVCIIFVGTLPKSIENVKMEGSKWSDYLEVIRCKKFLPIYSIMIIWGFTEVGVSQFQALHIVNSGYNSYYTSLFVALAMTGECICFAILPQLEKLIPIKKLIAFAFLIQFFRIGSLSMLDQLPVIVVAVFQFIGGTAFAIVYSSITQLISSTFPEKVSYSAHNLKLVVNKGIGVTCGSLMLGYIFEYGSSKTAYIILAIIAISFSVFLFLNKRLIE